MVDETGTGFGDGSVPAGSNDHIDGNVHRNDVRHSPVVSLHGTQDSFPSLKKNTNNH